jgi:hypothetical protein
MSRDGREGGQKEKRIFILCLDKPWEGLIWLGLP